MPHSFPSPVPSSNARKKRGGGSRNTLPADKPGIDLGYRPRTHVIAAIKGERHRTAIRHAFDADRVTPLEALYATPTLHDEDRRSGRDCCPTYVDVGITPQIRQASGDRARSPAS
jgi:hypothetical protein